MLKKLFQKDANFDIDKDEIAKLLKVDTQALKEFEEKYKSTSLNEIGKRRFLKEFNDFVFYKQKPRWS